MQSQPVSPRLPRPKKPIAKAIKGAIESRRPREQTFNDYRKFIQLHYDGIAGKLTRVSGFFSGHDALAGQVFKPRAFDLGGCRCILDAGCGDGRYTRHILRRAAPEAVIAAFDLSRRARPPRVGGPDAAALPRRLFRCRGVRLGAGAFARSAAWAARVGARAAAGG